MGFDETWDNFTTSEKELFQKCSRKLLKQTFIVREKDEENKKCYFFVAKNQQFFSSYFSYIGFDIVADRENGVIMLKNGGDSTETGKIQSNRFGLRKIESIVLCCLWTIYADRIRSGSLAQTYVITVTDINYALEKYGLAEPIEKTAMDRILKLFSQFNLIEVRGSLGDPECRICLYPSLLFALDNEEFKQFAKKTEERMLDKSGEEERTLRDYVEDSEEENQAHRGWKDKKQDAVQSDSWDEDNEQEDEDAVMETEEEDDEAE